jgi:hypothetical protein
MQLHGGMAPQVLLQELQQGSMEHDPAHRRSGIRCQLAAQIAQSEHHSPPDCLIP